MKILFLSTWWPGSPMNGSELRAHYLLRALAARHSVTALALRWDTVERGAHDPALGQVALHAIRANPFAAVTLPTLIKFASPIPVSLWPVPALRRVLRQPAYRDADWDAIVGFQGPVARYLGLVPARARVLDVDNSLSFQLRSRRSPSRHYAHQLRHTLSWLKADRAERRLLRNIDACTVVSSLELPYIRQLAPAGCAVALSPNGVDCERNRPNLAPPQPGALVYNGAMTYAANWDAMHWFLRDIYPLVRAEVPEATLAITGSTAGVDLGALALDQSVRLTGYVEDVRPVIAGSTVCVVPLRQGGGTRLKILEAMALGTPVVSTTKGAEGLEVRHGEHLLLADSSREFAAATVRLLRDEELRRSLRHNARRLVEQRYDWRAIGAAFVHLVEETVERKQRNAR